MPDKPQYVWPTPTATVTNPFGGTQYRSAGMTGNLPASNVGMDIGAKAGEPVRAPVAGYIRYTYDATADRNPNENYGYGGQVILVGDDGKEHRLSHLQRGSIVAEQGQRVVAGEQLARVGMTGNATGPHLDWEVKGPKGHENPQALSFTQAPAGGNKNVAGGDIYTTQVADLRKKVAEQNALAGALALVWDYYYGPSKALPRAQWLQQKGISDDELRTALRLTGYSGEAGTVGPTQKKVEDAKKAVTSTEDDLRAAERKQADSSGGERPQVYKGEDGRQWEILVGGDGQTTTRPIAGQGEPSAPARRIQIAGRHVVDLDAGRVIGTLPPQPDAPGDAEKRDLDLETGRLNLARVRQQLADATSPETRQLRQIEVQKAETDLRRAIAQAERETGPDARRLREIEVAKGELSLRAGEQDLLQGEQGLRQGELGIQKAELDLQRAKRPEIVNVPQSQRQLVERDQEGNYRVRENPGYETPAPAAIADPAAQYQQQATFLQAQARQELARLVELQREGVIDDAEAKTRFDNYWVTRVQAPLEGLRMAAENERVKQQRADEEKQRQENIRVENINRDRERYGYEAGEAERSAAAKIIPTLRSPAFLGNMMEQINRWGQGNFQGVQWTPDMFQLQPQQLPNLSSIASQGAARALAHISPAAAHQIKSPLPEVGALPQIPDIRALLPAP